ncbi:MAG: hypothetical protein KDD10_27660 [Phaeodactylibacter sp.]|nr:hypothetical protein [Phaeodactylibacter sp.]MCB9296043.1 hypothetical protein [Lewinellaceae bacterium]
MNSLFKISVLLLFAGLLSTACDKENFDEITPEAPDYQPDTVEVNNLMIALRPNSSDGLALGCITINYPFDLLQESGDSITISSDADFDAALALVGLEQVVDFVFPLSVTDSEGNISQVADNEELGLAFASCVPNGNWTYSPGLLPVFLFEDWCYSLVYPVSLEDGDGNAYTVNTEQELIDLFATVSPLFYVLPLTVTDVDGNQVVIDDVDSFFAAVDSCVGTTITPPVIVGAVFQIEGFGCNELVFPFNLELSDGSVVTINDEDDYANFVLGNDENFQLAYPFSLVNLITGDTLNIDTDDAFIESLEACGIIIIIEEPDSCSAPAHIFLFFNQGIIQCNYTVNYPAQVEAEGVIYDLDDMNDYFAVYNMYSSQIDAIDIVYPISITLVNSGDIIEFNSDAEICAFINDCG